ncbi:MAG TPA: DNA polymerase III subunit alpha [Actinomycetota bacterium]|nr:DNA polymerase III subunit alpha [Actinomycetota bacterium]
MSGFVHLHCHTTWSLRDGAIPAEVLPHLARGLGFEAVAMTDHDALTGAVRFSHAARDAGIKPIFGAELTLDTGEHVTAIVRDKTGYANLCRLISDAHLSHERDQPSTTFAKIIERAEGLFVLSGCERGPVARLAAAGRMPEAIETARRWRAALEDTYRIEVFDHRGYGHRTLRDRLLGIAKEAGIPAVATNDVHYPLSGDAGTHELLHAIKDIVPLSESRSLRKTSEYFFKTPAEMRALFADVPEACDETLRIAEACDFDLDLGVYHFPDIPIPSGETPAGLLARRGYEGARRRFPRVTKEIDDRLQHELDVIFRMGWPAYFLLVADIVEHTRSVMGIRCSCRGSAAGSLVCYVLGISDVDPVRYDLLFERFMNTRREEIPDIDVDVESHRREDVLGYILDTYGAEQTAICCMVDTFRARMAIREVGKALNLPPDEIDLVAKAFPRIRAKDISTAIERLPELSGSNLDGGQLSQLFELCVAIDGFPRHLALHPSGVILSSPDLADRVPMQHSYNGFAMLQADKDDVEELGLAKLDVLGVRMFSSITHAEAEIERVRGERIDLRAIPRDDEATFELIRTSKTLGCFQIESPGQRELLARFQPTRFEDLLIDISLFRPGPVKSDMVSPFLDRRHGFAEVRYPHPNLEPILRETYGVVVYHEQVIRVIAAVTGCSLDDADYVRRHLDAERPAMADDPDSRPGRRVDSVPEQNGQRGGGNKKRSSSHPGMGRGFRELPEEVAAGAHYLSDCPEGQKIGSTGSALAKAHAQKLGEDWEKDQRVHFHGVAGPIEVTPPKGDVATWFIESAVRNGYTRYQAETLWKEVFAFASFGFCKSHAAAFAVPTYISAWLKAHYTAEFIAGILTHDPGMYPRRLLVADARHFGIPILPIDVNHSDKVYRAEWSGKRLGVRLALSEVRDMSDSEVNSLLEARKAGPFISLEDLWRRVDLSRPVLENVVHVGALDSIAGGRSRRELLWRAVDLAQKPRSEVGAQLSLSLGEPIGSALPGLDDYSALEETEAEVDISGIDARRHVMSLYAPLLADLGCVPAERLATIRNKTDVWVAGVKVASQTPAIRSGQRIIFVTIDDLTGPIDVTVFERVQALCARTVFHSWLLLFHGEVRKRGGASLIHRTDARNVGLTVVVDEAFDLAEIAADRAAGVSLNDALERQRTKQRLGAGIDADTAPSGRLWHASGGSAGR